MDWMGTGGTVAVVMAAVGITFVLVGRKHAAAPVRHGWWTVPGVVVGWEDAGEVGLGYPIVEYALPDGSLRRFRNTTTVGTTVCRTGSSVTVLVDPEDPRRAELSSTAVRSRVLGAVFLGFGVGALVLGVLVAGASIILARALG